MQTYEYLDFKALSTQNDHGDDLNALGKDGWLVVAVTENGTALRYLMMRPIDSGLLRT